MGDVVLRVLHTLAISGVIRDRSGAPIADAVLAIEPWGLIATSGDDGTAVIALSAQRKTGAGMLVLPDVRPGRHDVRLELGGYRPWTSAAEVTAGERVRVAASLDR